MAVNLNVMLLLDDESRKYMHFDISDLAYNGVYILYELEDITEELLQKTNKIVILERYPSTPKGITNLKLFKEVLRLQYIYVGKDIELLTFMESIAKCYSIDISELNYERISGVVLNDDAILNKYKIPYRQLINPLISVARDIKTNYTEEDDIYKVADAYLTMVEMHKYNHELIAFQFKRLKDSESKLTSQALTVDKITDSYANLLLELNKLSLNLKQYESILSKNVYTKVLKPNYKKPPKIIYIKEYQELIHCESLLWALKNSINYQLQKSCKVVRLYDNSGSRRIHMLPQHYRKLTNSFTNSDVNTNDFIAKTGDHVKLLDIILENKIGLDVLIVLDCKDHNDYTIIGYDVFFNMCRNIANLDKFSLDPSITIVNNSKNHVLSWDYYKELSKLKTNETRLNFLTSRPIIQKILEHIEQMCNI